MVRNYIGDRNEGHLHNANTHVDNLLAEFRWLMPLSHKAESRILLNSAEKLAQTVYAREAEVRQRLDALISKIDAASTQTQANVQQATETLDNLKAAGEASVTNLTTKIDAAAAALTTEITSEKTRLDAYFEQQQTAHLATRQEWQREFSELLEAQRQSNRAEIDAQISIMQSQVKQFGEKGKQLIDSLEDLEQQAKEITGVTAAAGVTGAYIKEAAEQRKEADSWRRWASAFLFLTIVGALVTTIWSPLNGNVSTEVIIEYGLTRVPIVVVLGGIFTYAANQSGHHRTREQRARRRALELTAFRPFIGELSVEDQHALIKDTAQKYFRGEDDEPASNRISPDAP